MLCSCACKGAVTKPHNKVRDALRRNRNMHLRQAVQLHLQAQARGALAARQEGRVAQGLQRVQIPARAAAACMSCTAQPCACIKIAAMCWFWDQTAQSLAS